MFSITRTTVLALAAVAAIGAALVTSTSSADARGFGGGFSRGGGHANFARSIHFHRYHHRPHWQHHHHGYRPHYGVGVAAIAAPAYAAVAAPSAKPCTCLTKEYTADKLVVFKDLCTKEIAASPLGGMPRAAAQPQPGEVEPQDDDGASTK